MRLFIDAGNSALKWKLQLANLNNKESLLKGFMVYDKVEQGLSRLIEEYEVHEVYLAEVGGAKVAQTLAAFEVTVINVVSEAEMLFVKNAYKEPQRLGVDRFLAAIEAYYRAGKRACCVIDIGTAATVDVIANDAHQGGHIVPGLAMLKSSLLAHTDKVRFDELI